MCASIQAKGGVIHEDDLHGKFAEWVDPLSTAYRDYLVYEQPPVSQGFMVLEMLNIVEGFPLDGMDPVEKVHVMVEAKKLAFEDRIDHLEDPRFGDPQIAKLISKEYARERRDLISRAPEERRRATGSFGRDTTYLCVVDRDGNAVSLIQSIFAGFGSRVVAGDTGIVMNNRLCSFGLDPDKVNALAPGKRPAHTLNSYMVFQNGAFLLVGGTPGADDPASPAQPVGSPYGSAVRDRSAALEPPAGHSAAPRGAGRAQDGRGNAYRSRRGTARERPSGRRGRSSLFRRSRRDRQGSRDRDAHGGSGCQTAVLRDRLVKGEIGAAIKAIGR
jgi:gamma-glutamyltranspeptidase/glutathione hydrolase